VEKPVARALVERLEAKARAYKIGNGLTSGINMGPVVSERQLHMHLGHIEKARGQGARVVTGGARLTEGELAHGYFIGATVLDGVTPQMSVAREEVFGPVLSVLEVSSLDEALGLANDCEFGLTASIYSRDANAVMRFVEDVEVGMVHVNSPTVGGEAQIPFGGIKATGVGEREMAEQGVQFFTELKTVFYDFTGAPRKTNIY
jgi:aldehyde dehydrogenase (NAD+)